MLAQNFKSPTDLQISDREYSALVSVLGMLERGEITAERFNMGRVWNESECGTMGCILGWARHIIGAGDELFDTDTIVERPNVLELFMYAKGGAYRLSRPWLDHRHTVTVEQAATALRSYLTTGEARWAEALAVN